MGWKKCQLSFSKITARREWWGLFGVVAWMFLVITAVFALFPRPTASVLYVCIPVFFAPALLRRIYCVIRINEESREKLPLKSTVQPAKMDELFTPEEINVVLLLIEGKMRSEITRSLHLTAEEADSCMNSIRIKVGNMSDPDPVIAAAITEYKLTRRETDILRCFRREMTSAEIAAELFLSEETIKTHTRNLLKKLKLATRKDIKPWEESIINLNTRRGEFL